MKLLLLLSALMLMTGVALAQTTDLLITEYIEGSGNNKVLEFFNGSGEIINLGQYSLLLYANGGSSPSQTIPLDTYNLYTGETFVLVNSNADGSLLGYANQLSSSLTFNGDDALVLVKSNEVIDSIGTVGFDPGASWSCSQGTTVNQTLRRGALICNGDTDTSDDFDVCLEWSFWIVDSFDGLGEHNSDCSPVANNTDQWGSVKALYR